MPIPDYQTLMLPVLKFAAARDETGIRDCIAALADKFGLTDDERGELLPSGKQPIFANRVHWARTYLIKAGVLEPTRRAHFRVTPRGREVLARQPAKLDNQDLIEFPEFRDFRDRSRSRSDKPNSDVDIFSLEELTPTSTPEERIEIAYSEITNELRATLLDRVTKGSPRFFEKIVVDLLTGMGYGGARPDAGKRVGRPQTAGLTESSTKTRLG
jgi:restriction system protein